MDNTLTIAELKRRGMAAIEEGLQRGPLRILKRNRLAAVVLSEADYRRLTGEQPSAVRGLSAVQWLLAQTATGARSKDDIDRALAEDRNW
jgi:PHD/YefM family antitoxin component YafN of YafNO toxin-antitoxin module